ncbi:hypothetical protein ACWD48_05950 [Streptomyces sp. NPDC002519]
MTALGAPAVNADRIRRTYGAVLGEQRIGAPSLADEQAPRLCPMLRQGHVKLRVQEAESIGLRGTLYPRPGEPDKPDEDALILYDSPHLPFVVARQAVRELRRITVVAFAACIP